MDRRCLASTDTEGRRSCRRRFLRCKVSFNVPSGAESRVEVSATYTREGSKLNMRWKGAGGTIGTIEGSTFTMNNEGMIFA
jgi:hypothetical protein